MDQIKLQRWVAEHFMVQKTIRGAAHSYLLKHLAEEDLNEYVTNEEMIEACLALGLKMDFHTVNGSFNIIQCKPFKKPKAPERIRALGFGSHFNYSLRKHKFQPIKSP